MRIILIVMGILNLFCSCSGKKGKQLEKAGLYAWYPSESAPYLYPATIHAGYFIMPDKSTIYIPSRSVVGNSWGLGQSLHIVGEEYKPLPEAIEIIWLSFAENKFYFVSEWLPKERLKSLFDTTWMNEKNMERRYNRLVVGMAPHGMIQIWATGDGKVTELCCLHGPEVNISMSEFMPEAIGGSQEEYVQIAIKSVPKAYENLVKNGLPDSLLFENYRKRFNYHIVPQINMDDVSVTNIATSYFNGEYDQLLWERLKENAYSMQARPREITIFWKAGIDEYCAPILFDEKYILETFDNLMQENSTQKADLIIGIDKSGNLLKLTLKTENRELPIPIGKIQSIVYKNDARIFRSNNYNEEDWW